MKAAVIVGLLLAGNLLWFSMMRTIREKGYPMSFLNASRDLQSYRSIIEDSVIRSSRLRCVASLAAFYVFLVALAVVVFI